MLFSVYFDVFNIQPVFYTVLKSGYGHYYLELLKAIVMILFNKAM